MAIADLVEEGLFVEVEPYSTRAFATLYELAVLTDSSNASIIPPTFVETASLKDALTGNNYSDVIEVAGLSSALVSGREFVWDFVESGVLTDAVDSLRVPPQLVETAVFDDAITGDKAYDATENDLVEGAKLASYSFVWGFRYADLIERAGLRGVLDQSSRFDLSEVGRFNDAVMGFKRASAVLVESAALDSGLTSRAVVRADLVELMQASSVVSSHLQRGADLMERGYLLGRLEDGRGTGQPLPETGPEIPYGTGGIGYTAPVATWAMSEYRDVEPQELGTHFGLGKDGVFVRVPRGATGLVSTGNTLLSEGRRTKGYATYFEVATPQSLSFKVNVSEGPFGRQEHTYRLGITQEGQDYLRQVVGKGFSGRRWTFTLYGFDFKLMSIQLGSRPKVT